MLMKIMHISKGEVLMNLSRLRQKIHRLDKERRELLKKVLHPRKMIQGSLYRMRRSCGKPGCRCAKGDKHVSWYLSRAVEGKTKLTYIGRIVPAWLEQRVRRYQRHHKVLARIRKIDAEISSSLNKLRDARVQTIEEARKERR